MGNFDRQIGALVAMAQVTGTTGDAVMVRGFGAATTPRSGISRTGTGVYTLDFDPGMTGAGQDTGDLVTTVCCGGSSARIATRSYTSATRLTVKTFDAAGSAADADFDVTVTRATNHE